ncbi:MAG: hypothetical protein H7210_10800 [Pyrinomonadaceae bacterium]|nr:hypothetical protein [Phycisphaerales bacterium]
MKKSNPAKKRILLLAVCGTVGALGSSAMAQPFLINADGATLLQNAVTAPAITNDYIDVDVNGVARRYLTNQQLAPSPVSTNMPFFTPGTWWVLDYCAIGSVNGVQELATWGRTYDTNNFHNTSGFIRSITRSQAFQNRTRYINNGVSSNAIFNTMNPGGKPVRSSMDGLFTALYVGDDVASPGGITNDIAPVDVPTNWASTRAGSANFSRLPGQAGYGNNGIVSVNRNGLIASDECGFTFGHTLAELGTARVFGEGPTDQDTIFDTAIAFAPIAAITNFGTGKTTTTFTELRHLFATGRLPSGENLHAVTRDAGSGTRNAFYNSLCLDPSWGVGENLRTLSSLAAWDKVGPEFTPSNKSGSGPLESTLFNTRLGIGYSGAERGVNSSWLINGQLEVLGVKDDLHGGVDFVRPTITAILDNGLRGQTDPSTSTVYTRDGWRIGGPAVFATFGDPLSAPANKGGLGWGETFVDANGNGGYDAGETFNDTGIAAGAGAGNGVRNAVAEPYIDVNANLSYDLGEPFNDLDRNGVYSAQEVRPAVLLPAMRNVEAAAFLNNMTRSIFGLESNTGSDANLFTPGELLATRFILVASTDYSQDPNDPCNWIPNPQLNQTIQTFERTFATQVYANFSYADFGNATEPNGPGEPAPTAPGSRAGKVPSRQILQLGGAIVCSATPPTENGAPITYSDGVSGTNNYIDQGGTARNYTSNLKLRNLVAGDFNADGRRDWNDANNLIAAWSQRNGGAAWVSPAATGDLASLASLVSETIVAGDAIIEVLGDFNGDGNFGRIWNGAAFDADKSDVRFWADGLAVSPTTGQLNRAEGFARIDAASLALTGNGNFFNTTQATGTYAAGNSAADISGNGSGKTPGFAPVGTDGVINGFDIDYVYAQFKQNPRVTDGALNWINLDESANSGQFRPDLSGDITGNLVIDQADVDAIVITILGTSYGDVNLDGVCDAADLSIANANLGLAGGWAQGDVDGDGTVTAADITIISGCVNVCPCDVNNSGAVTSQDFFDFITGFFGGTLDYNGDGEVTSQDFFDFLACFFNPPSGC